MPPPGECSARPSAQRTNGLLTRVSRPLSSVPSGRQLADLLRLAKERPGQFSYGSSGTGGPHHLAMELFKMQAGVNIQHVPYKGGAQQLNDLLGGHIKIGSIGLPPAFAHPDRHPSGARGDERRAVVVSSRASHGGGVGISGVRGQLLARPARAGGDAGADRREAQPGGHGDSRSSGREAEPREARCRAADEHAVVVSHADRRGDRALAKGRRGGRARPRIAPRAGAGQQRKPVMPTPMRWSSSRPRVRSGKRNDRRNVI